MALSWSARHKMRIILFISLIPLMIVGYFAYRFFAEPPTCFDGSQNGSETGIDCGGTCVVICRQDSRSLVPLWTRAFEITPGVYNVVSYFKNPNSAAGVREVFYDLRFYNGANQLIAEPVTRSSFVTPEETSAWFDTGIVFPETTEVAYVFTTILGELDWERMNPTLAIPKIVAREVTIEQNPESFPRVKATLVNPTLTDYFDIDVIAIVYDVNNVAITASQTFVSELPRESNVPLFFTWPENFDREAVRVEFIPRINYFEDTPS